MHIINTHNINHQYDKNTFVSIPDITINKGDTVLVIGKSGSGKSTFLNIIGGLIKPTNGDVFVNGTKTTSLSQSQLDHFRSKNIGFVFQKHHFIQALTVYENIALAQYLANQIEDTAYIKHLLKSLQIESKINNHVDTLSEGEKQRVSIARALATKPIIILADEPTSALDDDNAHRVLGLLQQHASEINATLVIVTHDSRLKDSVTNQINLS